MTGPRYVSEAEIRELLDYWHASRGAVARRTKDRVGSPIDWERRVRWCAEAFALEHSGVTAEQAYSDLEQELIAAGTVTAPTSRYTPTAKRSEIFELPEPGARAEKRRRWREPGPPMTPGESRRWWTAFWLKRRHSRRSRRH